MKNTAVWLAVTGLIAFLTLSSCQSSSTKDKLTSIDSLMARLDIVFNDYQAIDTSSLFSSYNTFMTVIDSFNLYFDDNPQDSSFAIITRFVQAKGPFKDAMRLYGKVGYEIENSGGQLRTLRSDIRHRRWKDEELEQHLQSEAEAIKLLESELASLKQNIGQGIEMLRNELPRMRAVIEAMKIKRGDV